jgi:YD repeat-containing protein
MIFLVLSVLCGSLLFSCATTPAPAVSETPAANSKTVEQQEAVRAPISRTITEIIHLERKTSIRFADGSLDEYTLSEYNNEGSLITQHRYSASGALMQKTEYIYADTKLQTKMVRDMEDKLRTRVLYSYNAENQLIVEILEDGAGRRMATYEYRYDENGKKIAWIVQNGAGQTIAQTSYTWLGNLLTRTEAKDSKNQVTGYSILQYNDKSQVITRSYYDNKDTLLRKETSIWDADKLVREEQVNGKNQSTYLITYEYETNGQVAIKKIQDIAGKSGYSTHYEYITRERSRVITE